MAGGGPDTVPAGGAPAHTPALLWMWPWGARPRGRGAVGGLLPSHRALEREWRWRLREQEGGGRGLKAGGRGQRVPAGAGVEEQQLQGEQDPEGGGEGCPSAAV